MQTKLSTILFLPLLLSCSVFAQSPEQASESDVVLNNADSRNTAVTEPDINNDSNTDVDPQVFKPSEEISEDAPVAFPIDI